MPAKKPTSRKPAAAPATAGAAPAAAPAADRKARPLMPDDSWVTAQVIDAQHRPTRAGEPGSVLQLEVLAPRAYAGRSLYFHIHALLDKTLENLSKHFPGVNFLDADDVWEKLGHAELRAHVYVDAERTDPETHQVYKARNSVASLWPQRDRAAS